MTEKEEMKEELKNCQLALSTLSKNPDVQAYILLSKRIKLLELEIKNYEDNIENEIYPNDIYVWMYDFSYFPGENNSFSKRKVARAENNSEFRVYKSIDDQKEKELIVSFKSAIEFEESNVVIVEPDYVNDPEGLSKEAFTKIKEELLSDRQKRRTK